MSKYENFKQYDGARVQKRGYRRNEIWDEHKDFILALVQRGEKQRNILLTLENERGFKTNLNQLKSKLGIWGASSKNLAKKQRKWIYQMNQRRQAQGKQTVFYYGDTGQEITESQISAIMKGGIQAFPGDYPASPGELELTTPPPSGPDSEDQDMTEDQDTTEDQREPEIQVPSGETSTGKDSITPTLEQEDDITVSLQRNPQSILTEAHPQSASPIVQSPSRSVSSHNTESNTPIISPSIDHFLTASPTPSSPGNSVSFDDIYKKVLQKLESFHLLGTNSPTEVRETAAAAISEPGSPQFDLTKGDWPGPNSNEYTDDLGEWMEEKFDDAMTHFQAVEEAIKITGQPFEICRDQVVAEWIEEYEEDPLPFHVCSAIFEGQPVTPVINVSEAILYGTADQTEDGTSSAQAPLDRNAWVPTVQQAILTPEEWARIDDLHTKHYAAMHKKCNRMRKSNKDDDAVVAFRQSGAHLQFLRHTFTEFSYFTIAALGAFAYICYKLIIDDEDTIFLLECSVKAYRAIGICWHEDAIEVYLPLADLMEARGDIETALKYYQNSHSVTEFRFGPESSASVSQIVDLAKLNFKLGRIEAGDLLLKYGLKNIQRAANREPLYLQHTPNQYIVALHEISALYQRVKGDKIAAVVAKWAIQEFRAYAKSQIEENIGNFANALTAAAKSYSIVEDYGNAAQMHQRAFDINSSYYGEKDKRAVQNILSMCRAMRKRGLILYTVPILEKTLRLQQGNEDDMELQGLAFEVWMNYSKAVLKVSGHGEELKELKKRLAY
ncbi:hypothetical protein TWF730_011132 [Orbilia blumenaviensis]|uniref:Clr5 domain-containing protein n=1 Tax=Orbilia blumenaviensis TaxID=1796055 RepID=A0AAV9UJQ8_9PEZI